MSVIPNYGSIETIAEEAQTEQPQRQVSPFEILQQEAPPTPPAKVSCLCLPLCCLVEVCACVLEACLPFWRRYRYGVEVRPDEL